jgi:hypothetical protein
VGQLNAAQPPVYKHLQDYSMGLHKYQHMHRGHNQQPDKYQHTQQGHTTCLAQRIPPAAPCRVSSTT